MASKNEITVGCKVNKEVAEKLKQTAKERGIGVNSLLKEMIEGAKDTVPTMYEEELEKMANKLGTDEYTLLEVMNYLIDNKKLCRIDGKLKLIGMNADPSYISVDEAIDGLKAPEWKKNKYKQDILKNLNLDRNDDTGNGGGL